MKYLSNVALFLNTTNKRVECGSVLLFTIYCKEETTVQFVHFRKHWCVMRLSRSYPTVSVHFNVLLYLVLGTQNVFILYTVFTVELITIRGN